jgi:hypothetical protein
VLASVWFRRTQQDRIVGMSLDMLLQVLWTLESFSAEVTFVRLERHVDADMRGDVVAFDCRGATSSPLTGQIQVIGALTTDMTFADMILTSMLAIYEDKFTIVELGSTSYVSWDLTEQDQVITTSEALWNIAHYSASLGKPT